MTLCNVIWYDSIWNDVNIEYDIDRLDLKYKSIQNNNSILELLTNKINKSKSIEDIMNFKVKQNHINILNANLEKEIKKIKNDLSIDDRRKFRIIIIIINTPLFNYLKNKTRNIEEELIYLYTIAMRKKQYLLIPNVCDDVFYKVLNKLLLILNDLDIDKIRSQYNKRISEKGLQNGEQERRNSDPEGPGGSK